MHGSTRVSEPVRAKISRANSNQEHEPEAAMWWTPKSSVCASFARASARWPVNVGEPTWSSTTRTSGPRRSMVSTKFLPPAPNSHDERTMKWRGFASAVACSPASLVRPYAESGFTGSDSR